MDQLPTVFGLYDTVAEAQQAVQLLLTAGFTQDTVTVSTHPHPAVKTEEELTTTAAADQRSGRFLVSLFGEHPFRWPGQASQDQSRPGDMLITVQSQSVAEARQVADLLERAGSVNVTVQDEKRP